MRKQVYLYALVVVTLAVALVVPDISVAQQLAPKQRATVLATCAEAKATDDRALTYIFKFDVQEVQDGSFDDPQVVVALRSESGGLDLLEGVGGDPTDKKKTTCSAKQRYELTVMMPPSNPHFASFGVNSTLQDWKPVEETDD